MRKRLLAMLLTMCLLINIAPSVFAADPSTSKYSGKIISIMGDSISTFTGYIPDGYRTRYPDRSEGSGVDTVNDTWWMQLINELDAKFGISESWAGSTVSNIYDEDQSDNKKGPTRAMASWARIKNLSVNGIPDVILFYGGTNDYNAVYRDKDYNMGTFDPDNAPKVENYDPTTDTALKWDTVVDAFVAAILRMKSTYPEAKIVALLPINGDKNDFNTTLKAIYAHYDITTVSLASVASNGLWDTLHPNAYGMDIITAEVKAVLTNTPVVLPEHPTVTELLQEIPSDAYSDTNLWEELSPISEYYGKSGWDTTYKSIIIPVTEGDKIYASSFQAKSVTGGTSDGIRVTYFYGDEVVSSLGAGTVYDEFTANGYITVPDGVDAVCIPMWKDNSDSVVNLLTLPDKSDSGSQELTNEHAQWVDNESELYSDTNLWKLLEPEDEYYGKSGWGDTTYKSITIPVKSGDRIYANSFLSKADTGGTSNGIRVTYFNDNEMVTSMKPADVYAEFTTNEGYLLVPTGVNFVCIPMWSSIEEPVVNLLTLPERIDSVDLTFPTPVTGEKPVTEFSGTNYSATIAWNPSVSDVFAGGVTYTATIQLTAADGYKFAANYTATVNGATAEVASEGIVSYTFPGTENVVVPNSHLQWVADESELYSDSNLWELLNPEGEYYGNSGWGDKTYKSITIPVKEGDKIYASSFQAKGLNGNSNRNGIRVTYFYDNKVVNSMTPATVYNEFLENGYLTVPEGVNAVCIPMWKDDENAVVNLLTLPDRPASKGELSGDGEVDDDDAMILARYLAGWAGYEEKIVSMDAADVNGDGKVSDVDAMILARYVAGWSGYDEYFK